MYPLPIKEELSFEEPPCSLESNYTEVSTKCEDYLLQIKREPPSEEQLPMFPMPIKCEFTNESSMQTIQEAPSISAENSLIHGIL